MKRSILRFTLLAVFLGLGGFAVAQGLPDPRDRGAELPDNGMEGCQCSRGLALRDTYGVIFNCRCGQLQCVVVGPDVAGGRLDAGHSLVCR